MEPAAIDPKTASCKSGSRSDVACIGRRVIGYRSSNALGVGWSNGDHAPTLSVIANGVGYRCRVRPRARDGGSGRRRDPRIRPHHDRPHRRGWVPSAGSVPRVRARARDMPLTLTAANSGDIGCRRCCREGVGCGLEQLPVEGGGDGAAAAFWPGEQVRAGTDESALVGAIGGGRDRDGGGGGRRRCLASLG